MKEPSEDLIKFLDPFPTEVQATALALRAFIWERYPESNELIYDSYSALAVGWSVTDKLADIFISMAVYSNHVNLGFHRGAELEDPAKRMQGTGKLYRHLRADWESKPDDEIVDLMDQANIHALYRIRSKPTISGKIITKSVSHSKRRPVKT